MELASNSSNRAAPARITNGTRLADEATADLLEGLRRYPIWSRLALHEVRQRFHRSLLGPLWLTLSMGIMVAAMATVFSTLFREDVKHTLPYITTGLIFWGLLTSCIIEGTVVFTSNESFIRNIPQPLSTHLFRMLARNLIVWGFNMAIYLIILIYFGIPLGWSSFLFLPGFAIFLANASWFALAGGIISTRFRDIPPIINSLVQVVFFVTPVFWSPATLANRPMFVSLNPLYHLLEIVRAPLIGEVAPEVSWVWSGAMAVIGWTATVYLYRKTYSRIAYWV